MNVATTTAWGNADPLDEVLDRIAANHDHTVRTVELSIGALPVARPNELAERWHYRERFDFIAHHAFPGGPGRMLRPGSPDLAWWLWTWRVRRYSAHPPARKHCDDMWAWAQSMRESLAEYRIAFAVETMYEPRTRSEAESTGGHHLSTPAEVMDFCDRAAADGWKRPLVIDASHLHIGWCGGTWTEGDIDRLLGAGLADELHVSMNDGRRDLHQPLDPTHRIASWVNPHIDKFAFVVDEGRRRAA